MSDLKDEAYRYGFIQGIIRQYRDRGEPLNLKLGLNHTSSSWKSFQERFAHDLPLSAQEKNRLLGSWHQGLSDGRDAARYRIEGHTDSALAIECKLAGLEQQLGPANDHAAPAREYRPQTTITMLRELAVATRARITRLNHEAYRHGFAQGYLRQCDGFQKPIDICQGLTLKNSGFWEFMDAFIKPLRKKEMGPSPREMQRIRNRYRTGMDDGHEAAYFRLHQNEARAIALENNVRQVERQLANNDNDGPAPPPHGGYTR